jgi:hypothetical protein
MPLNTFSFVLMAFAVMALGRRFETKADCEYRWSPMHGKLYGRNKYSRGILKWNAKRWIWEETSFDLESFQVDMMPATTEQTRDVTGCSLQDGKVCPATIVLNGASQQLSKMGSYTQTGLHQEARPIYKKDDGDYYLYYMIAGRYKGWHVGPNFNDKSAGVISREGRYRQCPIDVTSWSQWDGSNFVEDAAITCSAAPTLPPTPALRIKAGDHVCGSGYVPASFAGYWSSAFQMSGPYGLVIHSAGTSTQQCASRCDSVPACIAYNLWDGRSCWIYDSLGYEVPGTKQIACTNALFSLVGKWDARKRDAGKDETGQLVRQYTFSAGAASDTVILTHVLKPTSKTKKNRENVTLDCHAETGDTVCSGKYTYEPNSPLKKPKAVHLDIFIRGPYVFSKQEGETMLSLTKRRR